MADQERALGFSIRIAGQIACLISPRLRFLGCDSCPSYWTRVMLDAREPKPRSEHSATCRSQGSSGPEIGG